MKKFVITAAVLGGAAYLAKRFAAACTNVDWEKRFESMPDNAPPKWMFRNISAIRANTERILELLSEEPTPATETSEPAAVA